MDNKLEEKKLKEKEIEKKMEEHKEEEKRKFPPFILLILLTTIVTLAALGLSFSAIELLESNETINTIISTLRGDDDKNKFVIFYSENINTGSGGSSQNRIYLVDQFPTPDSQGKLFQGDFYVFDFTLLVGKKTAGAYYELTAEELLSNNLNPSYVKLYLTKNGSEVDFSFRDNKKVKVYTDYIKSNYPGTEGRVIYKDFISEEDAKRGKIEFRLRMWISEDVMVDEDYYNKSFGVTVNTYASFNVDYDR